MSFPSQVQTFPALGVAGDFASANPRWSVIAGNGALVSGQSLYVGRFCWADPYNQIVNSYGSGPVTGFLGRNQQSLITVFLSEATMQLVPGRECVVYNGGDFLTVNSGSNYATIGMKAYANYLTGLATFAATGNPPQAASVTASIAAGTVTSVTGSIAIVSPTPYEGPDIAVLTVTAVGSGALVVGGVLSGTGVTTGTTIVSQLTGTAGGIGTYEVTNPQTVASTTITQAYGVMTVTAVGSGALGLGQVLAGTNVTGVPVITGFGTGTGGVGTYNVSVSETAASATVTATAGVETKWYAMSNAAAGSLVKISDHPLG